MEENHQEPSPAPDKSSALTRLGWVLLMLFFLAAIILDAFFSESGMIRIWELERRHLELSREVRELERHNLELEALIEALRNDPEAIERVAREELGYARPGEEIYLFPPEKEDAPSTGGEKVAR
jgi:cell division protein FtsB